MKFGLIWSFAVYPAGEGFRPAIIDWVIQAKQTFGWDRMVLTSDREYTIAKAIHQWQRKTFSITVRVPTLTGRRKESLSKRTSKSGWLRSLPERQATERKPKRVSFAAPREQWRYKAKGIDCGNCPSAVQCTTGKGSKMLCVNDNRDDLRSKTER